MNNPKENEEYIVYRLPSENGDYEITVYEVFSGISFIYSDAHIQSVRFPERKTASDNIFEISHCREGGSHREVFNPNGFRQSVANVKMNRAISHK